MARLSPRSAGEWGAVVPQWLGIVGLIFCVVFWAITDRVEPLLVTTFGGILTVGLGAEALAALRGPAPHEPEGGEDVPRGPGGE